MNNPLTAHESTEIHYALQGISGSRANTGKILRQGKEPLILHTQPEVNVFKITAKIIKPGGSPADWTHFSAHRMTPEQCEKLLSREKNTGGYSGAKVRLEDFLCEKVKKSTR